MTLRGEYQLERFKTFSINDHKHVTIFCTKGALWITAGKGFDDIVLRKGQSISIIADDKIVVEALENSYVVFVHASKECAPELALQN